MYRNYKRFFYTNGKTEEYNSIREDVLEEVYSILKKHEIRGLEHKKDFLEIVDFLQREGIIGYIGEKTDKKK